MIIIGGRGEWSLKSTRVVCRFHLVLLGVSGRTATPARRIWELGGELPHCSKIGRIRMPFRARPRVGCGHRRDDPAAPPAGTVSVHRADWGAGRRQGEDGASAQCLQGEWGRDGGITASPAGGAIPSMELLVRSWSGAGCVPPGNVGVVRGCQGFARARDPIELAFLIENSETPSGPTANLRLAMTSAGCTSCHAPSGR